MTAAMAARGPLQHEHVGPVGTALESRVGPGPDPAAAGRRRERVDVVIEQLGPRVWAPKDTEELSAICYRAVATRGAGFSITAAHGHGVANHAYDA
jgi:hypothetical protein